MKLGKGGKGYMGEYSRASMVEFGSIADRSESPINQEG